MYACMYTWMLNSNAWEYFFENPTYVHWKKVYVYLYVCIYIHAYISNKVR
jgi:hypothetical protein